MKSFVKQKNNNNNIIKLVTIWSYLFVLFVLLSLVDVRVEAKKVQYGELLTDDNELFLVENSAPVAPKQAAKPKLQSKIGPAAAAAPKPHPIVRRSVSSTNNSTNNKSKSVTSVKTTKKPLIDAASNKTSKKTKTTTTAPPPPPNPNKVIDTNKLIVKIVYTSSNDRSADQTRSDLTKLVYSTSESLSACEKAPCKSNEVNLNVSLSIIKESKSNIK